MNYVERHFGDWARDTAHLSMLEDGAYNRLVDLYYVREAPLPADLTACCRLVRAMAKQERDAVRSVLAEFFYMTDGGWRHKRCDSEIARFVGKSGKARASAKARWDADRTHSDGNADVYANASSNALRTHSERMSNAMPHAGAGGRAPTPQSPHPITNTSEAIASAAVAAPLTAKERVWLLGPPLLGEKARGLLGKLASTYTDDVLAEVLAQATVEKPIEPKAWVTAACEARAKKPKTNGRHVETVDLLSDPKPEWATGAGFPDRFQAENAGCGPGNWRQFRNGQRVAAA